MFLSREEWGISEVFLPLSSRDTLMSTESVFSTASRRDHHERYDSLIGGQRQSFEAGITDVLATLLDHQETVNAHVDRFLPDVLEA